MKQNYRKLWIKQYGEIPKDGDGRPYEIHHKDGNHSNNSLDNLVCIPIKEHYDIGKEPIDLEVKYINILEQNLSEEVSLVETYLSESKRITFRQFMEDGEGGGGVAANNAAATPGIAGVTGEPPVSKKRQRQWQTANAKGEGMFTRKSPKL